MNQNYITVLKQNFPKVGVAHFTDSNNYDSIVFAANGESIPTKAELDSLLLSDIPYVEGFGEIIRTFFLPIGIFSGTSVIPIRNSAPTTSQGSQIQSLNVVPRMLTSKFSFSSSFIVDCATNNKSIVVGLFRDNTCIYSSSTELLTSGRPTNMSIEFFDAPNTIAPITYSLRVGISTSSTWFLNQLSTGISNGGTTTSVLKISEYS